MSLEREREILFKGFSFPVMGSHVQEVVGSNPSAIYWSDITLFV